MRIVESYYCQFQNTFWLFLMSYLLIFQSLVVKIGKLFVPEQGEHKKFLHTSLTKHRTSKIFSYRLSRNFHKIHSIWIQTLTQPTFCTFVAQIVSISICAGNFCNFVSQIILTIKEFRKFYASHLHFFFLLLFIYNRTKVNVWEYNFPALSIMIPHFVALHSVQCVASFISYQLFCTALNYNFSEVIVMWEIFSV